MAGSVIVALMAASRTKPGIPVLLAGAAMFGIGCAAAVAFGREGASGQRYM